MLASCVPQHENVLSGGLQTIKLQGSGWLSTIQQERKTIYGAPFQPCSLFPPANLYIIFRSTVSVNRSRAVRGSARLPLRHHDVAERISKPQLASKLRDIWLWEGILLSFSICCDSNIHLKVWNRAQSAIKISKNTSYITLYPGNTCIHFFLSFSDKKNNNVVSLNAG